MFYSMMNNSAALRLRAWINTYRLWFNLLAHALLFAGSYLFTLVMLDELFMPGEARALFERTLIPLLILRLASFWYHDLYEGLWVYVSFADLLNIIRAAVISTVGFVLLGMVWEPMRVPQKVALLDMLFCMMAAYGIRLVARNFYENISSAAESALRQEIILAGPLKRVQAFAAEMLSDPLAYYRPVAIVDTSGAKKSSLMRISDVPVLSVQEVLSRKSRFRDVKYVVVCLPYASQEDLNTVVEDLKPLDIPFTTVPYFDELLSGKGEAPGSSAAHSAPRDPGAKPRVFLSPPHMSGMEQEYIRRAFQSNFIAPLGPMVDAFEREFSEATGIPHSLALSSGTAAIHLAMKVLGIGPGDTVIASTLTFIGSVTPITFQGATPIFIDCDRKSWTMDPALLEDTMKECAEQGKLPKAVLPTDLYGQCCDYERLRAVCDPYGVPLIVDAAEAMGAAYRGRHAGAGTSAAIYSFNGNKIITTSGGGMLASEDRAFVEQARFLSQQARDPVPHYEHSRIGFNYRMSNILAGIGLAQLKVLEDRVRRRREIFDTYRRMLGDLPGIEFMPEADYGRSNRWLTVILITPEEFGADREAVRLALEAENIEARPVWKPMHLQPVFRLRAESKEVKSKEEGRYEARVVGGAVSEDLFRRGLCLPSGTAMTDQDLERIVRVIKQCGRKGFSK